MLVRKCDICNHIIGDEAGYMVEIFRTSMPRGAEVRTKIEIPETSIEICSECKQAMFSALNERLAKYVLIEKEREAEDEE